MNKRILSIVLIIAGVFGVVASGMYIGEAFHIANLQDVSVPFGDIWDSWLILIFSGAVLVISIITLITGPESRILYFVVGGLIIAAAVFAITSMAQNFQGTHDVYKDSIDPHSTIITHISAAASGISADDYKEAVKVTWASQIMYIPFTVFAGIAGLGSILNVLKD